MNRVRDRILSAVLAVMLASGVCVTGASAVYAAEIQIQVGPPSVALYGTVVGFGGHEWVAIGDGTVGGSQQTDSVTLLLKNGDVGREFVETPFDSRYPFSGKYEGSDLHTAMKGVSGDFTLGERGLINSRGLDEVLLGDSGYVLANQYVWPLSFGEYWSVLGANQNVLKYGARWWLRSPLGAYCAFGVDGEWGVSMSASVSMISSPSAPLLI